MIPPMCTQQKCNMRELNKALTTGEHHMMMNSREPRKIEEPTFEEIYQTMVAKHFGKPFDVLREEVKKIEEEETTIWE
jgi:hypothetical protein